MRISALIAAVLTLSSATACTPAEVPSDAPPSADGGAAAAQRTWEARRPAAYAFDLAISCLCIHRGEYAVEVRNGDLASVRDKATGAPAPRSKVEWILIPDWLFDVMRQATTLGTPVRAEFDPALGYPTEVEIGLLADDSGTLYRITNLRPL